MDTSREPVGVRCKYQRMLVVLDDVERGISHVHTHHQVFVMWDEPNPYGGIVLDEIHEF